MMKNTVIQSISTEILIISIHLNQEPKIMDLIVLKPVHHLRHYIFEQLLHNPSGICSVMNHLRKRFLFTGIFPSIDAAF